MSLQTFMGLVLANTPEEKKLAEKEHAAAVAGESSDAENIVRFLAECEVGVPVIH